MKIYARDIQEYLADWFLNEFEKRELYDESESEDDIIRQEMELLETDVRHIIMNTRNRER